MRTLAIASLAALTSACGTEGAELRFDPCSPLMLQIDASASAAERAMIDQALGSWDDVLPGRMERVPSGNRDHDETLPLSIYFHSGDPFYRAIYFDGVGEIWISRRALSPTQTPYAMAHELGHAFGLLHVDGDQRSSVMNVGSVNVWPSRDDAQELIALWSSCSEA